MREIISIIIAPKAKYAVSTAYKYHIYCSAEKGAFIWLKKSISSPENAITN